MHPLILIYYIYFRRYSFNHAVQASTVMDASFKATFLKVLAVTSSTLFFFLLWYSWFVNTPHSKLRVAKYHILDASGSLLPVKSNLLRIYTAACLQNVRSSLFEVLLILKHSRLILCLKFLLVCA